MLAGGGTCRTLGGLAARGENQTAPRAVLLRQLFVVGPSNTPGIRRVLRLDLTKNPSLSLAEQGLLAYDSRMHRLLERLHTDHQRFARLLDFLAGELKRLASGEDADLPRVHDALEYLEDYPGQIHHPREDLLMECLAERALENQTVRGALHEEHSGLEKQTKLLRQSVADALQDTAVSREHLARELGAFIEQQRTHLQTEESMLFPLIERELTDEDWQSVQTRLPDRRDPLFEDTEQKYQALYERIV